MNLRFGHGSVTFRVPSKKNKGWGNKTFKIKPTSKNTNDCLD